MICTSCDGTGLKAWTEGNRPDNTSCTRCGGTGETSELARHAQDALTYGRVTTEDGRTVEPDHPDSPLRQAGMI